MSGQEVPSGSGSGSNVPPTKAIGSLAKKQTDVTRQGTQKLKFVPTLPARRKKEEVKSEPAAQAAPVTPTTNRGHGRGRVDSRGRGRGRGAPRLELEMTASGPFAMGPALAGNNARRSAPRSNFAPSVSHSGPSSLGSNLTRSAPPGLDPRGKGRTNVESKEEDEELYSDPDEGVEIVDMEDVRKMDWMAPESLRKERHVKKVKKEEFTGDNVVGEVNNANALDLSESEEEEELEDIIEHFVAQTETDQDPPLREERLYFFQFPAPFPVFLSKDAPTSLSSNEIALIEQPSKDAFPGKNDPASSKIPEPQKGEEAPNVDGVIGHLEIHKSGAVKMRLTNDILLDVTAATQPSFLQQAVYLHASEKRLSILGEVNKRFSVSPNVEALLSAMELADRTPTTSLDGEQLIQMDVT